MHAHDTDYMLKTIEEVKLEMRDRILIEKEVQKILNDLLENPKK